MKYDLIESLIRFNVNGMRIDSYRTIENNGKSVSYTINNDENVSLTTPSIISEMEYYC